MLESNLIRKGQFYFIFDTSADLVLEDKTKRGLEVQGHVIDSKYGVKADEGIIHDMDGIGHKVGIRWYFPHSVYSMEQVVRIAEEIEARYKAIRDITCPDDD